MKTREVRWRSFLARLREEFAPLLPVRVFRRKQPLGLLGQTHLIYDDEGRPHSFRVEVSDSISLSHALDVLMHEWAHCLSWVGAEKHHHMLWSAAYTLIYQAMIED